MILKILGLSVLLGLSSAQKNSTAVHDDTDSLENLKNGGKHLLFVYGTLKRGMQLHYAMVNPKDGYAKFLGVAETMQKYPMVEDIEYQVPFLLHLEGEGNHVEGELYEVDGNKLSALDKLEGNPTFYQRLLVRVKIANTPQWSTDSNNTLECWTYFITSYRPQLLNLPRLKIFNSSITHNYSQEETKAITKKLEVFVRGLY